MYFFRYYDIFLPVVQAQLHHGESTVEPAVTLKDDVLGDADKNVEFIKDSKMVAENEESKDINTEEIKSESDVGVIMPIVI